MSINKSEQQPLNKSSETTQNQQQKKPNNDINEEQPRQFQISTTKSFKVLNFTFASQQVFTQFMCYSLIIVLVPIIIVYSTFNYVKQNPNYSQLDKIIISVGPSLFLINVVIGIYIYKAIKDPQNYKKDKQAKHVIPVGFKEQNMNRRMNAKKLVQKQVESKNEKASQAQLETNKTKVQ